MTNNPARLGDVLAEFLADLAALQLPPDQARRRCLECNAWNAPLTEMCAECGKKLWAAMTPEEKGT